jgi:hypothetical protein
MMNKRTISKVIGGGIVTLGVGYVAKAVLGNKATAGVVAVLGFAAHERFNAPVSRWVYKQI